MEDGRDGKRQYSRMKIAGICLIVFIITFMVYANTLKSDFIWDDEYLILNNSQIKSFTHLPNVFKTYVGYGSENINNFYRPIQELSNMVDYFLWGKFPLGFHLTNVILHAMVGVMVFLFLLRLSGNALIALVASLFHAVHPVHTEAVAYIAGRADSLYALFMLLSMVTFIGFANRAGTGKISYVRYAFSLIFFVLSVLSKEIVITMPLLIMLYMIFFLKGKEVYSKLKWSWVPFAVIAGIYAWLRVTVLSFSDIAPQSVFGKIPLVYRLLTFFRTIVTYIKLMIFPSGLHMERSITISKSFAEPEGIIAVLIMSVIIFVAYKTYKHNKLISFAIIWFFANLLPVSNIVPINSFLAEHWIYMASIGPFLLVGIGVNKLYNSIPDQKKVARMAGIIAVSALIGLYARGTVLRNRDWKDEITFFNSTLKYHPRNARLYLNLGNTYYEKNEIEKAIEQYRKAIDINANYAVAYGNIGSAYLNKKDINKSEEYLVKAIKIKHNYPIAHYNLGIVYFQKKRYKEALEELKTAVEQLPQLFQAWNMMGRIYLQRGSVPDAKKAFTRSVEIMPAQSGIQSIIKKLK